MAVHPACLGKQNPTCTAHYHGTESAYDHAGCRCPHAREAHRIGRKRTREGRRPAGRVNGTGTMRRLQALAAIGWPFPYLADRLGASPANLRLIARGAAGQQFPDTANRVAALYRELSAVPGPSQIARDRAAAKDWLSPIFWDNIDDPAAEPQLTRLPFDDTVDEVLVCRAVVDGDTAALRRLNPAERVEAARLLLRRGLNAGGVSSRLKVSSRTAHKLVDQARQVAA